MQYLEDITRKHILVNEAVRMQTPSESGNCKTVLRRQYSEGSAYIVIRHIR